MNIVTFSEVPSLASQLVTAARSICAEATVKAVVIESEVAGADAAFHVEIPKNLPVEQVAGALADIARDADILLIGSTKPGIAIAAAAAAAFDTTTLVDASGISVVDGRVQVKHLVFGGGAIRTDCVSKGITIATIASGRYEAATGDPTPADDVPFHETKHAPRLIGTHPKVSDSVDLTQSKRIVCGGRGIESTDDVELLKSLAEALDGDMGCTRPLTEGKDSLFASDLYIGVSGVTVAPDLYFGVGVSGQAQHMVGLIDSNVVAVINKDPNCPAFRQCDYGIVGDLHAVVPAIIDALKSA